MTLHGGHIEHRDGRAGVRAGLLGGPDVWEVVTTEPDVHDREQRIAAVADYLSLRVEQVAAAFDYYDLHRGEVDAWIAENTRAAHEAHAAWQATQTAKSAGSSS